MWLMWPMERAKVMQFAVHAAPLKFSQSSIDSGCPFCPHGRQRVPLWWSRLLAINVQMFDYRVRWGNDEVTYQYRAFVYNGQWLSTNANAFVVLRSGFDVVLLDFQGIWTDRCAKYVSDASGKLEYGDDTGTSDLRAGGQVHFVQILLFDARCEDADRLECSTQPGQCKLLVFLGRERERERPIRIE